MPRKKKPPLSFVEQMKKLKSAQLTPHSPTAAEEEHPKEAAPEIDTLGNRVKKILGLLNQHKKINGRMLFFVMYDIESNKVRTLVHKYLKKMGCTPIQCSIFLANTDIAVYNQIKSDLAAVQESYENNDSIIILPVTTDYLRMMKIIGQKIEVDVITHSRNTLFF